MTWRQWFGNPYRAIATVVIAIAAGPYLVASAATLLATAINSLAGLVLLAAIIIFAFRRMTRL